MPLVLSGDNGVSGNSGAIVSGTAVSASGTSVDFTGIPSWVKRITVMFSGVSTSGTSNFLVQIGASGGIENTGYSSASVVIGTTPATSSSTAGFILTNTVSAASTYNGHVFITNLTGNSWVESSSVAANTPQVGTGTKTLSGTLDRVRITTVNGTDTFDAGTINIIYE